MSQNRSSVEAVVQSYFDGLYEGDAEKLGAIFHASGHQASGGVCAVATCGVASDRRSGVDSGFG